MNRLLHLLAFFTVISFGSVRAQEISLPFTGNTIDSSGHNHDAIIIGNVTPANDRFGVANRAYHFPGSAHDFMYVHEDMFTPEFAIQQPDSFSVSVWMQPENSGYQGYIFSRRDTNWVNGTAHRSDYDLTIGQAMISSCLGVNSQGNINDYFSATPLLWYHLVLTYSNSTAQLYVNDTLRDDNTSALIDSVGTGLVIGQYFKGEIDDINFYNRVLSASDVHSLFRMGTATGVGETTMENALLVFPNPATDRVTVTGSRNGVIEVRLLDASGRLLSDEKVMASCSLDLSTYNNGIYLLQVIEGDTFTMRKLVVSR